MEARTLARLVVALGWLVLIPVPLAAQDLPDLSADVEEARSVLESSQIQSAFGYLSRSRDETLQEWLGLCEAYGPSGAQSELNRRGHGDEIYRSRLIYRLFRIYGLEKVHIDDALNVVGVRRGTGDGPAVILNAHHDNVSLWPSDQPIQAFVADGRVWCPAARDDLMGVTQLLSVLRAMNAANIRTEGDIWFVTFTGEEEDSRGAHHFVRANVPMNLDWRRGDAMIQLHGGGGDGVTTGSTPIRHRTLLRVFVPLDWDRWRTDALDVLGPIISRINAEVRDPRSVDVSFFETGQGRLTSEILYLNMGMLEASPIPNGTTDHVSVRIDLRSPSEARLWEAHRAIEQIANDECDAVGQGCLVHYELYTRKGLEGGINGWDKVDNPAARMAAAAAAALYGGTPVIDSTRGCGDCVRAYAAGMPAMSFRGNVVDRLDGDFERSRSSPLQSEVRRKSTGHDVTESAEIDRLWSGIKHALVFLVTYAGLAD